MQVVLLATGGINKLWPLTEATPSPLLSIANQPVMEIVLEQLARSGLKKILVCVHHKAGKIESYFRDGRRWGMTLDYVLLREEWGTAGAIRWAKPLIEGTFLVMPADAIVDVDLNAVLEFHNASHHLATVVLHDCWTGQAESGRGNSETGVYVFGPQVVEWIPPRQQFDIHTQLLPTLSAAGQAIGEYRMEGYWNPLRSFGDVQDAQKVLMYGAWEDKGKTEYLRISPTSISGQKCAPGIWIGRNNVIHPSARFAPPVLLGENIRIGREAELGPNVVIGANAIIANDASIHNSTIFEHTYVGQLVHLRDRLVDKNLVVDITSSEHIRISDQFLLSETPSSIEESFLHRFVDSTLAFLLLLVTLPLTLLLGLGQLLSIGEVFQPVARLKTGTGRPNAVLMSEGLLNPTAETAVSLSTTKNVSPGSLDGHPVFRLFRFKTRRDNGSETVLGKWMERLDLHRLPELWNVITGDIRLVGVKPLALKEAEALDEAWQQGLHEAYSGFTGLWYVQTGCCSGSDETMIADVYYGATRSWKEDMHIMWETPRTWFDRLKKEECWDNEHGEEE